jgi:hypothetical protein
MRLGVPVPVDVIRVSIWTRRGMKERLSGTVVLGSILVVADFIDVLHRFFG